MKTVLFNYFGDLIGAILGIALILFLFSGVINFGREIEKNNGEKAGEIYTYSVIALLVLSILWVLVWDHGINIY